MQHVIANTQLKIAIIVGLCAT